MYIEPNSQVILLKDIPWNNNYEATMWFGDTIAQAYYFLQPSKIVATFNKQSYVRPSGSLGGTIEVRELADNLYNVNYMMFQNTNFGSKWFYAFVTGIEYVNNKNTRITFEIDVMQTWLIGTENTPNDYTLNECFVEREHSATDEIGDNLIDEGLELGEYKYYDYGNLSGFGTDYAIVVASTFDNVYFDEEEEKWVATKNDNKGGMYGGVYSGLVYNVFNTPSEADNFLNKATEANLSEGVLNVFMIPKNYVPNNNSNQPVTNLINIPKQYSDIDYYIPKNKKLFCYPYNMLCISDNNGNMGNFAFEYFSTDECLFNITVALACTPEAMLVPVDYKGVFGGNYNEKMVLNGFPQCAYNIDAYKAWVAQNSVPMIASNLVGGILGGSTSAISTAQHGVSKLESTGRRITGINRLTATVGDIAKSFIGGAISAIAPQITDNLSQKYIASTLPPQARGTQSSVINMATRTHGYYAYYVTIRKEFAQIIDDYFQKYGYATKRVKIPNVNVREHWTYVKTIGCTISGSLPADDESTICSIFDSGITFFKDEASFKSQSSTINRPLSEVVMNG